MRSLSLVALGLALLVAPAAAQNVAVDEFTLDNGMTWLLVPRHEEPNTVSAGWVAKVGSANERPGITGISHFFEHMMFKGTSTIGTREPEKDAELMAQQHELKKQINAIVWGEQYQRYRRGEIDDPWDPKNDTDELKALRAQLADLMAADRDVIVKNEFDSVYTNAGATGMNAFTTEDFTFFFVDVPSNKVELWCWMESDRLSDSVFREFYSERDVVHEERRMRLESSPTGELDEQFDAMFWMSSPYSWSAVGWPSDLNSYTRKEFDDYFNVYYRPNNLVGVVVGDFDPATLKPLLKRYFGRIEHGTTEPPPVVTLEMPQVAEKRMNGSCDCQPQVEVRYHTVPFAHADSYPLDILVELLNGRTGRLYKNLVEGSEIASQARANQDSREYAGYFAFSAQVKGDATPQDLEQAWYEQLERLKSEPVPEQELQKVKNQVVADSYRSLESNDFIRLQLGIYAAMGDWQYINDASAQLTAVTADDILRVANTYFEPINRSVAVYTRREGGPSADDPLASLSPDQRQQVQALIKQFEQVTDPGQLSAIAAQLEGQVSMAPAEAKPMLEYVIGWLKDRAASLKPEENS